MTLHHSKDFSEKYIQLKKAKKKTKVQKESGDI